MEQAPKLVVLVGGLPASGKSTLAHELAGHLDVAVLSRDAIRASIGDGGTSSRRGAPHVAPLRKLRRRRIQVKATRLLIQALRVELREGRSVLVEVVAEDSLRRQLVAVAAEHGAGFCEVAVECSDPREYRRRLDERGQEWSRIAERARHRYRPGADAVVVDSMRPVTDLVDAVIGRLGVS